MKCPECGEEIKVTAYGQCAVDCDISDDGVLSNPSDIRIMNVGTEYECFYCGADVTHLVKNAKEIGA